MACPLLRKVGHNYHQTNEGVTPYAHCIKFDPSRRPNIGTVSSYSFIESNCIIHFQHILKKLKKCNYAK